MLYKFYTTTQSARNAMIDTIRNAEKSIYLEMYIFVDDTYPSHDFIGILKDKLRKGIKLVMIVDVLGSFSFSKKTVDELRSLGAEIYFFSHFLRRIHRKILIVDGKIAFIGGVNIKWGSRNWYDLLIKLSGFIVKPILKSFAYTYKMSGGTNEYLLNLNKKSFIKKIKSRVVENRGKRDNIYHLNNYYKRKLLEAKNSIVIVTPYLIPPRWMIALIHIAIHRGVYVEIIIPEDTDIKSINYINYYYVEKLYALGVKFYFMKRMNHAKAMIIDSKEAIVGSQNIDFLSFDLNAEVGIFFSDKKAVNDLEKIILKRKEESVFFVPSKVRLGFFSLFIRFILRLFSPIL